MQAAAESVKHSLEISNQYRRKSSISQSFGRILKKTDYNSYTEGMTKQRQTGLLALHHHISSALPLDVSDEIHAELCYAESLLFKAAITFTEDETLMSFVKGGLKIRSCYQSYKY